MAEILPCPFCGNSEPFMRYEWQVCCGQYGTSETSCACEGPFADSEAEAIAAWNHRASTPSVDTEGLVEKVARRLREISAGMDERIPNMFARAAVEFMAGIPPALNEPRGEPIGAYATAVLKDGSQLLEVMSLEDIAAVRKVSRAANNGPWVSWFGEMARKTVMRRLSKRLPMSTDLEDEIFSRDETMRTDLRPVQTIEAEPSRQEPPTRLDLIEQQIGGGEAQRDAVDAEVIEEQADEIEERIEGEPERSAADEALDTAIQRMKDAKTAAALETVISGTEQHRIGLTDPQLIRLDIAISQERKRFEEPAQGELVE